MLPLALWPFTENLCAFHFCKASQQACVWAPSLGQAVLLSLSQNVPPPVQWVPAPPFHRGVAKVPRPHREQMQSLALPDGLLEKNLARRLHPHFFPICFVTLSHKQEGGLGVKGNRPDVSHRGMWWLFPIVWSHRKWVQNHCKCSVPLL